MTGSERQFVDGILSKPRSIASDGEHSRACAALLRERLGLQRVLFTPSCTAALEIAALLTIRPGDEVIAPSFTFVTSISAFTNVGAKPVFCDIRPDTLNMDERQLEALVTPRTKAIVAVHYGGVAAELDAIRASADRAGAALIEDAAQALSGRYKGRPLGSLGDLACFSFHSTKNYQCGEGGGLVVNDENYWSRAEIHREKGTNRSAFIQGLADKYTWVDRGSSYVPSELSMAFLRGQLAHIDEIKNKRRAIYDRYTDLLRPLEQAGLFGLPSIPEHCDSSYHLIYVMLDSVSTRDGLLRFLGDEGIGATFHYVPLHMSPAGSRMHDGRSLPVTESIHSRLLRLPLYPDLSAGDVESVCAAIYKFFGKGI